MARTALSTAEVAAAFEKILTQGEAPTAETIHALLGKGSVPLIEEHLKYIKDQSRLDLAPNEKPVEVIEIPETPMPATETAAPSQNNNQGRRPFRRERFNNRHTNNNQFSSPSRNTVVEVEETIEVPLEQLSEEALTVKVRRLESILMKEQSRREVAERIMEDTKDYADSIKEQVGQRINDLRQNMDLVIEQLKNQLQEQKHNFDQDLKYYQEQLSKANEKIASLLK